MKIICSIIFLFFILPTVHSQKSNDTNCKPVQDSSFSAQYFKMLFSNLSGHAKPLALVKLEFNENNMFYVTELKNVKSYCQWKYNIPDSSLEKFTKTYLMTNPQLPLADTLFFASRSNQFKSSFYSDTVLSTFRNMGVKNFLMKYFEGRKIRSYGAPLPIVAYLYESRIFWENITFNISPYAMRQIESEYKIKWDDKKGKWIDKSNF